MATIHRNKEIQKFHESEEDEVSDISDEDEEEDNDVEIIGEILNVITPHTNLSDILADYKIISNKFKAIIEDVIAQYKKIKSTTMVSEICERQDKLVDKGYAEDEAFEKAYNDRKYALKCFIQNNWSELHDVLIGLKKDDDEDMEEST